MRRYIIFYKILIRLFPSYKKLFDAYFFEKISFNRIFETQFNLFFHRKNTIAIGGYINTDNFGDALNVPLLKLLTSCKVAEVDCMLNEPDENLFMIGSIIQLCNRNTIVWGSGIISKDRLPTVEPKKILAVRGPLSRDILLSKGYDCTEIYGDPALLLPKYYNPKVKSKYSVGIIPHYMDKNHQVILSMNNDDVKVIDINSGRNWKSFVKQVLECKSIVSSSLHGLIIADAYKTPNVWVEFSDNVIGDGFKFRDYFLSVNREFTEPVNLKSFYNEKEIKNQLNNWKCPEINVDELYSSFPYPLRKAKFLF